MDHSRGWSSKPLVVQVFRWSLSLSLICPTWHCCPVVLGRAAGYANTAPFKARDSANVTIQRSSIRANGLARAAGGGIWLGDGSPSLTLLNSSVSSNKASSGGGLWLGGSASALINGSSISDNQVAAVRGTPSGLGGGIAVTDNATVSLGGNSTVDGNTAGSSGAGVYTADTAALTVAPDVRFGLNEVVNKSYGYDVAATDASRLVLTPVGFSNNSTTLAGISKCSRGVALERSPCGVGEFRDNRTGVCMCCPERTYSFDASGVCLSCPENGACPGGDGMEPLPGYWRSSNASTQMHLCPLGTMACAGGGKCMEGYTGRLCSVCQPGYGTSGPLRCSKCLKPRLQLLAYIAMGVVTVVLVAVTVHFTYADNVEGSNELRASDILRSLVWYVQQHAIIGCVNLPWPAFFIHLMRASEVVFGIGAGSALSLQCWAPQLVGRPKDKLPNAMRVQLVTLFTPLLVFATIIILRLLWWALMWCASGFARNSSRGCVSTRCVKVVTPSPMRTLVQKLPVLALVTLFFAYPTLLRTAARFLSCLHIESPVPGSTAPLLSHRAGYLMIDPSSECWVGWHRTCAIALGIPMTVLFYVVVPVAMFWLLKANQQRAGELRFRANFGFLYRNYKPQLMWWESVWTVQTVVLSALAVQHFAIGAYASIWLMAIVFFAFGCAQAVFKPYAIRKLHQVHYAAAAVLFVTTMSALAMFHIQGQSGSFSEGARTAIAVLALAVHVGFVGWCLAEAALASGKSMSALVGKVSGCLGRKRGQGQSSAGGSGRVVESVKGPGISEYAGWSGRSVSSAGSASGLVVVDSAQQLNRQLSRKPST